MRVIECPKHQADNPTDIEAICIENVLEIQFLRGILKMRRGIEKVYSRYGSFILDLCHSGRIFEIWS